MAIKVWFITGANRGIRSEIANTALVDSNQFEATGRKQAVTTAPPVLATLLPITTVVFL
jgi:hypothetical protein